MAHPARRAFPSPDATFDAVTLTLALHHAAHDERLQAVEEMARVLRRGGRLLVADLQEPARGPLGRLICLFFGHALQERPLEQAEMLTGEAGLVGRRARATTISWLGVVTAPQTTFMRASG